MSLGEPNLEFSNSWLSGDEVPDLARERSLLQRNDGQEARALVLHRPDEPLDHREAAVLADGAEPLLNAAATAPRSELLRRELNAVVGDEVRGPAVEFATHSS
jgi:hypothetical protein